MGERTSITIEFEPDVNEALEHRKKRTGLAKSNIIKRATAKELGMLEE